MGGAAESALTERGYNKLTPRRVIDSAVTTF